jgi:hypothetical protein
MAMVSRSEPHTELVVANGAAMAAVLGSAIGSFAIGAFVLLNEAGLFAAPALYGPAGGVTGRTTFATIVWLAAWGGYTRAGTHAKWRLDPFSLGQSYLWCLRSSARFLHCGVYCNRHGARRRP